MEPGVEGPCLRYRAHPEREAAFQDGLAIDDQAGAVIGAEKQLVDTRPGHIPEPPPADAEHSAGETRSGLEQIEVDPAGGGGVDRAAREPWLLEDHSLESGRRFQIPMQDGRQPGEQDREEQ